jgi:hypothetical protein
MNHVVRNICSIVSDTIPRAFILMTGIRLSASQEALGMFIWDESNEDRLMKELTLNVTPPKVRNELPGVIAYTMFMCVRWADHINSAHQLQSMLTACLRSIKHSYMVYRRFFPDFAFCLACSQ